jgi:hypothetical protein
VGQSAQGTGPVVEVVDVAGVEVEAVELDPDSAELAVVPVVEVVEVVDVAGVEVVPVSIDVDAVPSPESRPGSSKHAAPHTQNSQTSTHVAARSKRPAFGLCHHPPQ